MQNGANGFDGGEEEIPYLGYVADICYEIFGKSPYRIEQVEVTAKDRFCRMRGAESLRPECENVPREPKIDVLCGATTVRLDDIRMVVGSSHRSCS